MTNSPDVPVTDADRASNYAARLIRTGNYWETVKREDLESLVLDVIADSTAALQGEVERLKAELESLNENGAEFCRGLIDEIQALAEERWNGAPAELDTLDRRTIIEIRSHQTGEHGKTRLLLGAAVDIIDKLHGSAVCSRQIMDAAEREREAAVKDRDALQSRVEQLEATWNSTTDDDISVASEKFYNDYPPGSYCSDFAFRAAEIINLYFLRCRDLQSRVAPPVERASVLGEEEIIKEFRELVAQTPTLSPGTDVLLMLKAEKAPELLAAYDRLQAALAESQEAQSSMIEHNRWFADRLDKANAALSQRRPQVVAPVGSYVPTGEIRQPRTGEWAMENGSLSLCCFEGPGVAQCMVPIYRRIDEPCGYEFALRLVGKDCRGQIGQIGRDADGQLVQIMDPDMVGYWKWLEVYELIPLAPAPAEAAGDGELQKCIEFVRALGVRDGAVECFGRLLFQAYTAERKKRGCDVTLEEMVQAARKDGGE